MAPRRGGGGRGGGGSGGLNSPWSDKVQFYGSRFSDPVARGTIIIQGICAFALLVIIIAVASTKKTGASNKKTTGSTRKVFAWSRYQFSLTLAIIAVGSDLASYIIRDSEFEVRRIYLLIELLLSSFYYLAEILLLATTCWLLTAYFLSSGEPPNTKSASFKRTLEWIHNCFLLVLFGLWVGIMYASIRYQVTVVKYDYDFKIGETWIDLNLAFLVLYLCATIEVMTCAVIAFSKRKTEIRHLVIFLSLVAMPLLIHSCISTAIAARIKEHIVSSVVVFVDIFFSRVCIVLAYIGILLIARQLELAQRAYPNGGIIAPPPPGLQNGHASYPTQWQKPGTQDPPQGQEFNVSPSSPQFQGSAYIETVATNNSGAPWTGQNHQHPNGYAPVPQHNGGGGA